MSNDPIKKCIDDVILAMAQVDVVEMGNDGGVNVLPPIIGHNPDPQLPTTCPTCLSKEVSLVTYSREGEEETLSLPVFMAVYFCRACKTGFTKPYRYAKDAK